jgi:hypothetical protein
LSQQDGDEFSLRKKNALATTRPHMMKITQNSHFKNKLALCFPNSGERGREGKFSIPAIPSFP